MDKIFAMQDAIKDYLIVDYGEGKALQMLEKRTGAPRYFNRHNGTGKFYHVGDKMPDSVYMVSNYPVQRIRLVGLKKKLIILDLWNVNCHGCINAMPAMQKLQEEFKDQVQVILVTKDSKEQVEEVKRFAANVRDTHLPFINGENVLGYLFDYTVVPQQVWIDGSGTVVYKTIKEIANENTVRDFLAGKRMDIYETKDTTVMPDYDRPMASTLQFVAQGDYAIASYLAPHKETKYYYFSSATRCLMIRPQ
jgi:thiol-disulfide isomerase/thioredoxin